jgi:ankyrin repeat protein
VSAGHAACVQMILETAALSEADYIIANHEDDAKEAPLHVASRCGNLEIVELLVKHGANTSAVDAKGRTCLHCAVQSGHNSCLRFLLERDHRGLNCLHIAVKQNSIDSVQTLLTSGADVEAMTPDGIDVLQLSQNQKSRKLIDVISKHYDLVQSRMNSSNDESDLFQGLEVYERCGNSPSANLKDSAASSIIESRDGGSQGLSSLICQTEQDTSQEQQEGDSHAESFYCGGQLWFTFLHNENGCIHPYFLRAHDNHSQVSSQLFVV